MNKRDFEVQKYSWAYKNQPKYRIKRDRMLASMEAISSCQARGSYLDVSTGRGDMLAAARDMGFKHVMGTEVVMELLVPGKVKLAYAHDLPFATKEFQVVSMLDVIEHLLPGDDERACRELDRVATKLVVITANNMPSVNKRGDDLHINKRPYAVWDALFREWFSGQVEWVGAAPTSHLWKITY